MLSPLEKTGAIRSIELSFSNNLPLRLVFQTAIQRRTVINFNDVSTGPVDDAMFNFEIPDNIDLIDDRPKTY